MLSLSERVCKRARLEPGYTGENAELGDLRHPVKHCDFETAQIGHATPVQPPPLQLNLDPAGVLASTPTRVSLGPQIALLTNRADDATNARTQSGYELHKLRLNAESKTNVSNSERNRGEFAGNRNFTWDDLIAKVDGSGGPGGPDDLLVGGAGATYYIDFDAVTKEHVIKAAINAAIGLESNLVYWDEPHMQFHVAKNAEKSKFGDYLALFAKCGSYLRRLRRAAGSIRDLVQGSGVCRTALALATAIDYEVSELLLLPTLDLHTGLATLYSQFFQINTLALSLAELVGCADLRERGRLLRVPTATTILERAYSRAILQQSQFGHGAMLWRVVAAVIGPSLDELSFVVGITEPLVLRKASRAMQKAHFPKTFFSVDEETSGVSLDEQRIPSFLPIDIARAALQCYRMLVVLGEKGYDAMSLARTDLRPLSIRGSTQKEESPSFSLTQRPTSVQHGVRAVLTSLNKQSSEPRHVPQDSSPPSVESEIWRSLIPVIVRYDELNRVVKLALQDDLKAARDIIVDVYLLGNGAFWSIFQDLVSAVYSDWQQASALLPTMNALVSEKYPGASFVIDLETPNSLRPVYTFPKAVQTAFSDRFLESAESVFSMLLNLYYTKQDVQFALLSTEITAVAREIDKSLNDPAFGFQEVVETFERVALVSDKMP